LKKKGYFILDKNFRCPFGEIDVVAKEGQQIVFVEVKTRQNLNFGLPEEAVDYRKKKRLTKLALFYLKENHLENSSCRFDVVSLVVENKKVKSVYIIKNAFEATF